eukprot:TRINITY_DN1348_c0_g1_i1.p1 TRINITY_DN1348_c0_g1~~TRINITY_DN1348_c0_g1_i1.p1  ORF type:complete len:322 (+),score=12.19 TRINITY_DN1348_c0_g1_i1:160-1125(+)
MKRLLDLESSSSPSSLSSSLSPSENWNFFEDEALQSLAQKTNTRKWRKISKELNTQFKHTKRTPKQCHARWVFLQQQQIPETNWSENEETVLMFSLWNTEELHEIVPIIKTKSIDQMRKHLCGLIKQYLEHVTNTKTIQASPLELLKAFFYCHLVIRYLEGKGRLQEVAKVVAESGVDEKMILEYVANTGRSFGLDQEWSAETLALYMENVMERIENEMQIGMVDTKCCEKDPDDTFEGIMHKRGVAQNQNQEGSNVFVIFTIVPQPNTQFAKRTVIHVRSYQVLYYILQVDNNYLQIFYLQSRRVCKKSVHYPSKLNDLI